MTLLKKLNTKLKFSFTFHPQIDGQTEVLNKSLDKLLRCFTRDKLANWDLILAQEEFVLIV